MLLLLFVFVFSPWVGEKKGGGGGGGGEEFSNFCFLLEVPIVERCPVPFYFCLHTNGLVCQVRPILLTSFTTLSSTTTTRTNNYSSNINYDNNDNDDNNSNTEHHHENSHYVNRPFQVSVDL